MILTVKLDVRLVGFDVKSFKVKDYLCKKKNQKTKSESQRANHMDYPCNLLFRAPGTMVVGLSQSLRRQPLARDSTPQVGWWVLAPWPPGHTKHIYTFFCSFFVFVCCVYFIFLCLLVDTKKTKCGCKVK